MQDILLIIILVLLLLMLFMLVSLRRKPGNDQHAQLQLALDKLGQTFKEDSRLNRDESAGHAKESRQELNTTLERITEQNRQAVQLISKTLEDKLDGFTQKLEENHSTNRKELGSKIETLSLANVQQMEKMQLQSKEASKEFRDAIQQAFTGFRENLDNNIRSFTELQREKFSQLDVRQADLLKNTEAKLESIRVTVEEKLEKTLSERLGQSFETVGKQLIEVQKGLGEMQTIATDVGGLKKVLSNVKLRGGVGEVQLALLLEQMLAPNQYDANVRTKKGSSESVEFAIKLPGRSEDESAVVYLPVDAKFPKDAYETLITAYELGNPDEVEAATKSMENTIKKMGKDIRDKYIDPPHTTDFAIMFLPFESIYAEVIRRSALVDQLRDEFKITVAGPTTLMAILNSLQMGFRTLALQKRSSEVWGTLAIVKSEFEKFGGLLEKAQKNIQAGMGNLDEVMGKRTRAIQRQLRNVEALPAVEAVMPELLGGDQENGSMAEKE